MLLLHLALCADSISYREGTEYRRRFLVLGGTSAKPEDASNRMKLIWTQLWSYIPNRLHEVDVWTAKDNTYVSSL